MIAKKTHEKLPADWLGNYKFSQFQDKLNSATEDGKFEILAQLLCDFEKSRKETTL